MYYNIRNGLGTAALALIIALVSSQQAYALLPLGAEQTASDNALNALPNEISLNDANDDDALLAPPTLDNSSVPSLDVIPAPDENAIPLTSNEQPEDFNNNENLNLPNLNSGADFNAAPATMPYDNNQNVGMGIGSNNTGLGQGGGIAPMAQPTTPESNNFGEGILSQIDNELFNQMSDLEKQTSLLTLELRREKVKNEIAAIKAARQKAIDDANTLKEEKERKRIEWEKEQERKLLVEEQKLKALNIAYEKLRQESIVKAYKEQMLTTNQKWIENDTRLYGEIVKAEDERDNLVRNFKMKLNHLEQMAAKAADAAETAKKNYSRELANLQTQIAILKSRLEAEKLAREQDNAAKNKDKANPFASITNDENAEEKKNQKLSDEYAIMEISGKGDNLAAKLINKSGTSFMVQKGTVLQSGHIVDEISQTYIRADKNGTKDYLYFAAGGILDREPVKVVGTGSKPAITPLPGADDLEPLPGLNASQGLPSLREGMFIR